MKAFSNLDFLEISIWLLFFGVIALTSFLAWYAAGYIFPDGSNRWLRAAAAMTGLAAGFYIAGWVVFKDLGPRYSTMVLSPFFAPKIRVIVPEGYTGYVTVLFGDALGTMNKDNEDGYYAVEVNADGTAIVACPPRLAYYWDGIDGFNTVSKSAPASAIPRRVTPGQLGYSRARSSSKGVTAFVVSFYYDKPERLAEIQAGTRELPPMPDNVQDRLIDSYLERYGAQTPL